MIFKTFSRCKVQFVLLPRYDLDPDVTFTAPIAMGSI